MKLKPLKTSSKLFSKIFILAILIASTLPLSAEFSFLDADINKNGDILFSAEQKSSKGNSYTSLFLYTKQNKKIKQLTFFPETLNLVGNNRFLQISNENSFLQIDLFNNTSYSQSEFETVSSINNMKIGLLKNMQVSPDGRWLCIIEPVSRVFGRLILIDSITERQYVLSEKTVRNLKAVKWAPDSETFLYEEDGMIYFARTSWFSFTSPPAKKFRQLAKGSVKDIRWISKNQFIFLSGKVLYKVNTNELFTKSFYGPIFSTGELIAQLPVDFNSRSDKVFISPNGESAVFVKAKRNVYYFKLNGDDYSSMQNEGCIPFLLLAGSTAEISVYWKNNTPFVFAESLRNGKITLDAWHIPYNTAKFEKIPLKQNAVFLAASPQFRTVAIKEDYAVSFYNTDKGWKKVSSFDDEKIVSAVWKNEKEVFLGGETTITKYTIKKNKPKGTSEKIYLTGLKDFSWSDSGEKILVEIQNNYKSDVIEYNNTFKINLRSRKKLSKKKHFNKSERIYIDSATSYFSNMLYIRSLKNYSTRALFIEPMAFASKASARTYSKYKNTSSVFSYGKRNGKKEVALVFDAMDNMDGIAEVLYVLKKNKIKATFFINGEALRQNPNAIREIVKAGHQCGSLFFTTWNLSDLDYRIDEDFITRGLARNEDNFYAVTGSELSLIWHSPYYIASSMMINAGKKAGYIYISPDIRIPDWISKDNQRELKALYKSPPEIIEELSTSIAPGSIIPISLSKNSAGQDEHFYSYLQLLIDVLKELGYSISDIKGLME